MHQNDKIIAIKPKTFYRCDSPYIGATDDLKGLRVDSLLRDTVGGKRLFQDSIHIKKFSFDKLKEKVSKIQLYSLTTPNGQKVSIALEEMRLEYDAHKINIMQGNNLLIGISK